MKKEEEMALQDIRTISPGIVQDPLINSGRPIVKGTRVFVDRIIGHLEDMVCHLKRFARSMI